MTDTLPYNFMGLEGKLSDYKYAKYTILPIPYEATVSFRSGTREGPLSIINASRQLELFDHKIKKEIHTKGISTMDPIEPDTRGPEKTIENIYKIAQKIVRDGKFLIGIGGEHTITVGLAKAVKRKEKRFTILCIDAHLDMRYTYQRGKFSHACTIRRVHELGIPTVSVGIRNIAKEEYKYVKENKIPVFMAEDIYKRHVQIEEIIDAIKDQKVYVSVDMDGFDPAYAPGVGTPEPGGLDWFFVEELLEKISQNKTIIAADITETLPLPGQAVTEFLASKVIAKIIGLTL